MAEYLFEGDYQNNAGKVELQIILIHFQDESKVHFIYSPHLDLTGYGMSEEEAKSSFTIVLEDFIDYTLKKKTLGTILKKLGWSMKGTMKRPKNVVAPSLATAISDNDYVSEIFDKYPVNTYKQSVGMPAFA